MKMKRLKQCLLLITILGGLSISEACAQKNNFANLARYAKENAALPKPVKKEKRDVFMGNSITEGWVRTHPDFFKTNGYIGRGISGQTSYQFLLRFREDVINLSYSLIEYKNYLRFKYIIDDIKNLYKEKDKYKGVYNSKKKEISKTYKRI